MWIAPCGVYGRIAEHIYREIRAGKPSICKIPPVLPFPKGGITPL